MAKSRRTALALALMIGIGAPVGTATFLYDIGIRKPRDYRHSQLVERIDHIENKSGYRKFAVDFATGDMPEYFEPTDYMKTFGFHTPIPEPGEVSVFEFAGSIDDRIEELRQTSEFMDNVSGKTTDKINDKGKRNMMGWIERLMSYPTNFWGIRKIPL